MNTYSTRNEIDKHEQSDPKYLINKYTEKVKPAPLMPKTTVLETTMRILSKQPRRYLTVKSLLDTYPCVQALAYYDQDQEYYILNFKKIVNPHGVDLKQEDNYIGIRICGISWEFERNEFKKRPVLVIPQISNFDKYAISWQNTYADDMLWRSDDYSTLYIDTKENYKRYKTTPYRQALLDGPRRCDIINIIEQQMKNNSKAQRVIDEDLVYEVLLELNEINIYKAIDKILKKAIKIKQKYGQWYVDKTGLLLLN